MMIGALSKPLEERSAVGRDEPRSIRLSLVLSRLIAHLRRSPGNNGPRPPVVLIDPQDAVSQRAGQADLSIGQEGDSPGTEDCDVVGAETIGSSECRQRHRELWRLTFVRTGERE